MKINDANNPAVSLTASEAVWAIRDGGVTAEEYVSTLIAQAKRASDLNLFIAKDDAALLVAARDLDRRRNAGQVLGEFAGIPLLVKDNIETSAFPTTSGTPSLANNRPKANAPVLERLLKADALLFGKTNMHELAMGATSDNAQYGAVHNPYSYSRIPGGSSGGTAAGIAARVSPAGLGTDTTGSARIPASLSGVVGFRPSPSRYSAGGVVPVSHTRDTIAPMARIVYDIDLMDRILVGRASTVTPSLADVRLGLPKAHFWSNLSPDVETLLNETIQRLQDAGCTFVEVQLPYLSELLERVAPILQFEAVEDLRSYLQRAGTSTRLEDVIAEISSADVAAFYQAFLNSAKDRGTYLQALQVDRPQLQAVFAEAFRKTGADALCYPATPITAPLIGDDMLMLNGASVPVITTLARNENPAASAGLPALTLPAGLTPAALPIGLELAGPVDTDTQLLVLGMAVERVLPRLPAPPQFI